MCGIVESKTRFLQLIRPMCLSDFRSFHTLNNDTFRQMFLMQTRVVIIGMQVDNDLYYCRIESRPERRVSLILLILPCWLVGFGFNGPLRQYFSLYRAVSQR